MTPGEQFPDLTPANLGAALDHPVTFNPVVEPLPFWVDLIAMAAIAFIAVGFVFAVKGL